MDNITFAQMSRRLKALIVIGFFAIIGLIVWLSVQIVAYAPSAFTSLASLAQGISQYKEAMMDNEVLVITSALGSIESAKPVTISWEKDDQPGTYAFSYGCDAAVSVEIFSPEGMRAVSCDMRYSLGDVDSVTLVVESTKSEPANFSYAISFMRENDIGPIRIGEQTLAITPAPTTVAVEEPKDGEVLGESDKQEEFVKDEIVTPAPIKPAPVVTTVQVPEYTYAIPVSNPNGYTDLATRFLAVGDIVNNTFMTRTVERDGQGAFQFEVKNIGTKTSDTWTYTVTLPDGDTYTSPKQTALKPNERAVISLGFDTPGKASHTFVVVVKVDDKISSNNSFKKTINFVK